MFLRLLAMVAAVATSALAQESGVDNSTTPTTTQGEITIHTVTVGKLENQFHPNSILTTPGDIVSFQFYVSNHSVIRAKYGFPCIPYEDVTGKPGFYSGPAAVIGDNAPLTWNLTINSTAPVFYYCGAPGSCIGESDGITSPDSTNATIGQGMVGTINANASTSLVTQLELAKQANYMLEPGQPLPQDAMISMSSMAASVTTATVTATDAPSTTSGSQQSSTRHHDHSSSSSSGLSTGAIAGMAVGAAAVALIAASLCFLLGRNRTMKGELRRLRAGKSEPRDFSSGPLMSPATNEQHMSSMSYSPPSSLQASRHLRGQMPPYANIMDVRHQAQVVEAPQAMTPHDRAFMGDGRIYRSSGSPDFDGAKTSPPLPRQAPVFHEMFAPS